VTWMCLSCDPEMFIVYCGWCFSVLIARNDIVKISDFGTSREWSDKSIRMSFAGTVAWMAPEVIRNEPCSEKVDVWSVSQLSQCVVKTDSTIFRFKCCY